VPHRSSEDCVVGLDLLSIFPQAGDKIASISLSPDHSRNAHFAFCIGEDSDHYAGCAVHCCETCLTFRRRDLNGCSQSSCTTLFLLGI
jgi:hypothetical protein